MAMKQTIDYKKYAIVEIVTTAEHGMDRPKDVFKYSVWRPNNGDTIGQRSTLASAQTLVDDDIAKNS
ncbi:MAG: hypothetical protein IAG10_33220 [Planctomycetaceae bacterium]|nr:hypothetical protein [Planctomycetaceae bacterium]